ncbi:MAG: dipeptidase [Cyclobacteriaceae bacterium]|nr:dipeptidase [Cyclobacteriaceae bacterium]
MNRIVRFLIIFLLFSGIIFFFVLGKITDRKYNRTASFGELEISFKAKEIHQNLLIADMHADNLLWDRNPTSRINHGHVDIPRLLEGNYALQVFDAVIQTPKNLNYYSNTNETDNIRLLSMANRWPIRTWNSLYQRALYQSELLHNAANESPSLEVIKNKDDLAYFLKLRKNNSYRIAGILSIEGLHALEGNIHNLDGLYQAGYRMMGLVHFFDNEVGGSSSGVAKGGLTDFGKTVIRQMEDRNITIDLAHASPQLIRDVTAIATRPVAVSHTGIKAIHDSPRNLSDEEIALIAKNGGLIGIGFWEEATGSLHPRSIARSIRYVADRAGIEHVTLGSDFDGAVKTGFDSSEIIYLTEALLQEGFDVEEIKSIMGGNQLRFFLDNLPDK